MGKIIAALCFLISFQAFAVENAEISLSNSADSMRLFNQLSLPNVPSVDENSNSILTRKFVSSDSATVLACKKVIYSSVMVNYACVLSVRLESEENTSTMTRIAPTGAIVAELNDADSNKLFSALVGIKRYSSLENVSIEFNNNTFTVPRLTVDCPNAITDSGLARTGLCQIVAFK